MDSPSTDFGTGVREEPSLETKLSERIQIALDALIAAETETAHVSAAMRRQRVDLGLEYSQMEDDIARLVNKLYYMKYLVEGREAEQLRTPVTPYGRTVVKVAPVSGGQSFRRTARRDRSKAHG
jgi:hypothetical protein